MEQRILLMHPAGKKAVSMDKDKYDVLKQALLNFLKEAGESTHTEILKTITYNFRKNNIKFQGSVEWHLEWVKLDLEARNEICRSNGKSPDTYRIT